jgi:hypothetical protein
MRALEPPRRARAAPVARFRPRVALRGRARARRQARRACTPFEVSATLPKRARRARAARAQLLVVLGSRGHVAVRELSPAPGTPAATTRLFLRMVFPEDLEARARDPKYVEKLERVLARFDAYIAKGRRPGVAISAEHPVAYFCAEFGLHESLQDLLGRPRHPRRRPPEVGERPRAAAGRRRAVLSARLPAPALTADGEQLALDRRQCAAQPADRARARRRRRAARGQLRLPGHAARCARGACGRPRDALPARLRRTKNRPEDRRSRAALRRRPRDAPAPGDRARPRRRRGCSHARRRAERVPHQRRPRGVPRARARRPS